MADGKVDRGPAAQSSYQQLLDELPRTGPGTRGGEMLRRYWHPVCLSANLKDIPIAVRMLGEDSGGVSRRQGRTGAVGHSLPASLGVVGVWPSAGRRPDVLLSWLEIRHSGTLHRHAAGASR